MSMKSFSTGDFIFKRISIPCNYQRYSYYSIEVITDWIETTSTRPFNLGRVIVFNNLESGDFSTMGIHVVSRSFTETCSAFDLKFFMIFWMNLILAIRTFHPYHKVVSCFTHL